MYFRGSQYLGLDSAALMVFSITHVNSLVVKKGLVVLFLQYFSWFRVKNHIIWYSSFFYNIHMS